MLNRYRIRQGLRDEGGFTLIELLVVILIIGILAAIAIPSFLNQQSKAQDSQAKELARTAETTAETIATDNSGSYSAVSKTEINKYEKTISTTTSEKEAWLSEAKAIESNGGYEVETTAPVSKDTFVVKKKATGEVERTCKVTKESNPGGCKLTGGKGTTGSW